MNAVFAIVKPAVPFRCIPYEPSVHSQECFAEYLRDLPVPAPTPYGGKTFHSKEGDLCVVRWGVDRNLEEDVDYILMLEFFAKIKARVFDATFMLLYGLEHIKDKLEQFTAGKTGIQNLCLMYHDFTEEQRNAFMSSPAAPSPTDLRAFVDRIKGDIANAQAVITRLIDSDSKPDVMAAIRKLLERVEQARNEIQDRVDKHPTEKALLELLFSQVNEVQRAYSRV